MHQLKAKIAKSYKNQQKIHLNIVAFLSFMLNGICVIIFAIPFRSVTL